LENPARKQAGQVVSDLQDLAVDTLVHSVFEQASQHQKETGAPQKRKGQRWEKHLERAGEAAADSARVFRDDLRSRVLQDREALREALLETMRWWQEKTRTGSSGNLDYLLERLADTLAAVLVFQNLGQAKGTPGGHLWDVLLRRVVQRVIVPRLQPPSAAGSEDSIQDCVAAILERAAGFTYRGLGPAIEFFTHACRLRKKQEPRQVETEPLSGQAPEGEEEGFVRTPPSMTAPSAEEEVLSEIETGPPDESPGDEGGWTVPTFEEEFSEEPPSSARSAPRELLWERMNQALKRDEALRFWVLFWLKEDRNREWEEIATLVLQNHCGLLSDDDLPPAVTWEEVKQAFQDMAQRSRTMPGVLTAEALRQFYSRAMGKLGKSAG